jgi:hypothetical protein
MQHHVAVVYLYGFLERVWHMMALVSHVHDGLHVSV